MIRIIRLIGSVLIVLVGFVLGILVNNALADMFLGGSEWIGAIAGTVGHLVVFLLALFLASKVEGKKVEWYFWTRKRLGIFSGRSRCWNWSVSAYY